MFIYIYIYIYWILEKQYHFFISTRSILRSQYPSVKNGNNFVVQYNKMLLCYLYLPIYIDIYICLRYLSFVYLLKALVNGTTVSFAFAPVDFFMFLRINFLFFFVQYHSQIFDRTCSLLIGKFVTLYYIY